ncbi:KAP family NTPase [uncultured Ferrimonas sp.]|uniref:KAP family P-loop NTPase fold protein n=1 Tax=uncultured Ferrimonas sp. TaxID=432640 RepID=UPI00262E5F6F|nr:KAP family NTPase [uncultured Ferrimonas sp.]
MTQLQFKGENGRDEFQREAVAAKVISLLTSTVEISPMVIDGDWGTGKTEFCHKLINKFKAEHDNYQVVYVDAFQADHADAPLMTILAEVLKLLPEGEQRQGLIQKALPVARYGLKTLLKAGAGHILRQDADDVADGLEEQLKDAANKAIDAAVETALKDHEKAKESLMALQTTLADIAADSPIVLFVDELDRCRPDFAVQMLEVIKHTFDVAGVQFVFVTNATQLKAAINHSYGQGVDAQRYLDKFLKFSFALPEVLPLQGRDKVLASTKHFTTLIGQSEVVDKSGLNQERDGGFKFVKSLIEVSSLSLRETETFVRHLEIYHTLIGSSNGVESQVHYPYRMLRLAAVYLHCFYPTVARAVSRKNVDVNQFAACFGINDVRQLVNEAPQQRSALQVIAMMVIWDCNRASSLFAQTDDQELNPWVNRFHDDWSGYRATYWEVPDEGGCVEIVTDALGHLSFNANL